MKKALSCAALIGAVALVPWVASGVPAAAKPVAKPATAKPAAVKETDCFICHTEIEALKGGGKHAGVNCVSCHSEVARHLEDQAVRPGTRVDHQACGGCHQDQYDSFVTFDYKKLARVEKSQPAERSPNPLWEKLMMGHGFTREHAAPRGHAFMLVDHLVVDRAYGGQIGRAHV